LEFVVACLDHPRAPCPGVSSDWCERFMSMARNHGYYLAHLAHATRA
jgi:hypothetical protein